MARENEGFFKRLFGQGAAGGAPEPAKVDPQQIINDNRDRGNQFARTLETVIAQVGLSDRLGEPADKDKRLVRIRNLRDEFQSMPPIEVDVKKLDLEVLECLKQLASSAVTGDAITLDYSVSAMEYASKVRVCVTSECVEVMRLFVNRSKLSTDVFDRCLKMAEQEKTLSAIQAAKTKMEDEIAALEAAGKKFKELRAEQAQLQNIEDQEELVKTAIGMLVTTINEYKGQVLSITVNINNCGTGGGITGEQLEEISKNTQDAMEKLTLDFKQRMEELLKAKDRQKAHTDAIKTILENYQLSTIDPAKLVVVTIPTVEPEKGALNAQQEANADNMMEELKKVERMLN